LTKRAPIHLECRVMILTELQILLNDTLASEL
jgi:hypothetical protein